MSRSPYEVFQDNMADADVLVGLAEALANTRARRMRRELRESVGTALGMRRRQLEQLDCVESDDVFVVLKPGGRFRRADFTSAELRPLLRQAVVAASAAVETYVADKACEYVAVALRDRPPRLKEVSVNLSEILDLDEQYTRRGWGYRKILQANLRDTASPAPSKIGIVFSIVGRRIDWARLDAARAVPKGRSAEDLEALYARRNSIAHQADRSGTGRRSITLGEVRGLLANARSIVQALDAQLPPAAG